MSEDLHDRYGPEARYAVAAEAALPTIRWEEEVARGLELGLPGADSIVDRRRLRRKLTFWRVCAFLFVILALVAIGASLSSSGSGLAGRAGPYIARETGP